MTQLPSACSARGHLQLSHVFFPPLATLCSVQDLSSPIRDQTHSLCIGSTESYPLDHQGTSSGVTFVTTGNQIRGDGRASALPHPKVKAVPVQRTAGLTFSIDTSHHSQRVGSSRSRATCSYALSCFMFTTAL